MAERVVKVKLTATMDQYVAAMGKAADATRSVGAESAKLAQTKQAFDMVGRSALVMGGLAAAGIGVAIAKFADFDQAMSNVAATGADAKGSIEGLREAALDAGARTVYSATEAANAIEELAKAGVSAADVLSGGLDGALDLAAAGGIGVAEAAGVAATALKTFNLEGSDMSHVADLLAAGAGKAMGSVGDLSAALNQSALVASKTGLSIEETTAGLAAFASQGLLGSDAGTSFKTMLLALNPTSAEAAKLMDELNLSAYDQQGQFIGLSEYAGKLQTSLGDMSAEQQNATLKTIFGNDAYRAAAVLLDEGATGIENWTAKVNDQGYAAETAATKLDNLKGDFEAFQGALDSALISMGSAADGPLRGLVQGLTGLVDGFNGLPVPAQQGAFWIAAAATAVTLAGGAYLVGVPKVAAYNAALATLGTTAQRTGRVLGALSRGVAIGAVVGAAVIGVDALSRAISEGLLPSAEQVDNKMRSAKTGVELFASALNSEGITNTKEAASLLGNLGTQLDAIAKDTALAGISGTAYTVGKSLGDLAKTDLPLAQAQFRKLSEDAGLSDAQMSTFIDTNEGLRDALTSQATAAGLTADKQTLLSLALGEGVGATEDNAGALEELQGVAVDTETAVGSLEDAIRNFGSAQFDTQQASLDFTQALLDLDAQLAEGAGSLDANTQAGIDTGNSMLNVAQNTNDYAASIAAMGGTTEEVQGVLERGRQKIIATRMALGETESQARAYADALIATPENIATQVALNGVGAAESALSYLTRDRVANIFVRSSMSDLNGDVSGTGRMGTFAVGGAVRGPGSSTSDSVTARLSNGEHVWTAAEVRAAGGQEVMYAMRAAVLGKQQYGSVGGSSASTSAPAQVAAPQVQVFIGDEEVTGRVRVVVKDEMSQVARSARLGGGR